MTTHTELSGSGGQRLVVEGLPTMPYVDHGWDEASQLWCVSLPGIPQFMAQGASLCEAVQNLARLFPMCLRHYREAFERTSEEVIRLRRAVPRGVPEP